jgi:hypothetical protein
VPERLAVSEEVLISTKLVRSFVCLLVSLIRHGAHERGVKEYEIVAWKLESLTS